MKRLTLLVALVMAMAVLAPAAFADEAPDAELDETKSVEKEFSEARQRKARMIADYFAEFYAPDGEEITEEDVVSLRTGETFGRTVGWGVAYHLYLFGFDPEDPEAYEGGWAIGQLRKTYLEDDEHDKSDLRNMNFGQLQKEQKFDKPAKATPPPGQAEKDKTGG